MVAYLGFMDGLELFWKTGAGLDFFVVTLALLASFFEDLFLPTTALADELDFDFFTTFEFWTFLVTFGAEVLLAFLTTA